MEARASARSQSVVEGGDRLVCTSRRRRRNPSQGRRQQQQPRHFTPLLPSSLLATIVLPFSPVSLGRRLFAAMAAASNSVAAKSYASRIPSFANPAAKHLLEVIERKKCNLAVSVDVTKKQDLLSVVKAVADDVCMVKVGFAE